MSDGWTVPRKIGIPFERVKIRAEIGGIRITPSVMECFDLLVERQLDFEAEERQRAQDNK